MHLVMPFKLDDLVQAVNPVKLYEYVYSHKPAIAIHYAETEQFEQFVHLYRYYKDSTSGSWNNLPAGICSPNDERKTVCNSPRTTPGLPVQIRSSRSLRVYDMLKALSALKRIDPEVFLKLCKYLLKMDFASVRTLLSVFLSRFSPEPSYKPILSLVQMHLIGRWPSRQFAIRREYHHPRLQPL